MALQVTSLNIEHHRPGEALGVNTATPRLSWKVAGEFHDWVQQRVEIQLCRGHGLDTQNFVLDTRDSVLVSWPGTPLCSGESVSVRIRTHGLSAGGQRSNSEWSAPEVVEAGLLERQDWSGTSLIKSQGPIDLDSPKLPVRFRRTFNVPTTSRIQTARLYITAHGVYEAQINNSRVGDHVLAPGWQSYNSRLAYQTFDVASLLRQGENAIGVDVAEGWFSGRLGFLGGHRNLFGDHIGLIAKLIITLADGSVFNVATDEEWKSSPAGELVSAELYDGEICDLRRHTVNWSCSDYDAKDWKPVEAETLPKVDLFAPSGPPVRGTAVLQMQKAWSSPSGKQLLDFGQNIVGRLRIRIPKDVPDGTKIVLSHAEVLENGELGTRPLRYAKCQDVLITSKSCDVEFWEPRFTFHGFRYAQIDGWLASGPDLAAIEAIVLHTDMQRIGEFECSDPLVTKLHQNIVWSMRGNFLSVPTDCPQRDERLGWTGDLAVFAPTANYLYNTTGMLSDWLRDLSADQLLHPRAVPPLVVPDMLAPYGKRDGSALWGDVTTLVPWSLYLFSGDSHILRDQYPSIQGWLDQAVERDESGLWSADPDNFEQLGDWLDPKAPADEPGQSVTDPLLTADAFLIRSTEIARDVALRIGKTDDAAKYKAQSAALRQSFQAKYITSVGRIVSDSQTAYALSLNFSLFPSETQTSAAAARLRQLVLGNARFKIATGFAGTPYLPHALSKIGATQLFYRMLMHKKCPSWLYQVTLGATTMWERWDSMLEDGTINPGDMTSFNHYALGSVGNWIHEVIGGIRVAEPGGSRVRIAPQPGADLSWSRASHETPYGLVECLWRLEGNELVVDVQVPLNSTAEVVVPGLATKLVGSGRHSFRSASYKAEPWPPKPSYPKHYPHVDDEP